MSDENVEVVRRFVAAYLRGDIDEALTYFDPDVVYKRVEEAAVQGLVEMRASWERWEADWEDLETIPEDFIDAGDRVLVAVLFRGRGRGSGIEIEGRFYEVLTLQGGKVIRWEEFDERSAAIEAAGLPA
jgi:ketosteroid isomerase-like protein